MLLPCDNRSLNLWGRVGRLTDMTETKIAITRFVLMLKIVVSHLCLWSLQTLSHTSKLRQWRISTHWKPLDIREIFDPTVLLNHIPTVSWRQ